MHAMPSSTATARMRSDGARKPQRLAVLVNPDTAILLVAMIQHSSEQCSIDDGAHSSALRVAGALCGCWRYMPARHAVRRRVLLPVRPACGSTRPWRYSSPILALLLERSVCRWHGRAASAGVSLGAGIVTLESDIEPFVQLVAGGRFLHRCWHVDRLYTLPIAHCHLRRFHIIKNRHMPGADWSPAWYGAKSAQALLVCGVVRAGAVSLRLVVMVRAAAT